MGIANKYEFEKLMIDLLGLPKSGVKWFELRCSYDEEPSVKCEYEIWDEAGKPMVVEDRIATLTNKYTVILKEIKEE